jgi:predicted nucleotide-binding protein
MAKKTKVESEPPQVKPEQGIIFLSKQIEKAKKLLQDVNLAKDDYSSWELVTRNYLEKAFGVNSPNVSSITNVGKYGSFPMNASNDWWENRRKENLRTQIKKLEGLLELLETEHNLSQGQSATLEHSRMGHTIFLVHGHSEAALHETARYLEKLNQDVVVLREQPNQGRTIIEKFEDYADVGFAVILMTNDDRGGKYNVSYDKQMPRARQNVIFEFGYFVGRLGRNRVCALYSEGVEIPSDYSGVLYIPIDEQGAWRMMLAKEMRAAGFPVDMNLAL